MITIPHFSWLRRLSVSVAIVLIAIGATLLLGWAFQLDEAIQLMPGALLVPASAALGFLVFGLALLSYELGSPRGAWIAALPAALGLAAVAQSFFPSAIRLDEFFTKDYFLAHSGNAEGMPLVVGACFGLAGLGLTLCARGRARFRTSVLAVAGSVLMSVGFSTCLGYALNLPVVFRWGGVQATPLGSALLLLILGTGLLATAWRESQGSNPGAPVWIPLPVVVASATFTVVLWLGLRDAETTKIGTSTQVALRDFATAVGRELDRQTDAVESSAQTWSRIRANDTPTDHSALRSLHTELLGAQAVYRLDSQLRTAEIVPVENNESLLHFDHGGEAARRTAIVRARERGRAAISATLPHVGNSEGFAIYAPISRSDHAEEYLGADISYRRFFAAIDRAQKLSNNFQARVLIGPDIVFESTRYVEGSSEYRLEEVFPIADRRVRIELSPSLQHLRRTRRLLPEIALGAGCGITLLLGLSVHFARAARSGLRAAEQSNRRLQGENEERRRVEEMLKVSDERLRLALESTQIGIFEWHVQSNSLYYSPGVWTMLGYEPGVIPNTPAAWTALIHPDDLAGYRAGVEQQLRGETHFIDPEYRVRNAKGEWRWLYARSRTVGQTSSQLPTRIIGTLQDITGRKKSEDALRLSQATTRKLSLVASRTDNLVIIGSKDGRIEWVNESFERVMEYQLNEVVGRIPLDLVVGPETSRSTIRRIKLAIARGQGISADIVNYSKSGKKYHMHLEVQPVRNEAGELENFIAVQADISARVETEQYLRRAKAEADAASRAKSEFLASMSHEIRTPMNGVIGMTSLLLDTPLNHEQRDCVNTIRNSGEALLTIINDILDFSKIESGKMELEHLPFELAVTIEDALDLFSVQASSKKLELVYQVADDVPAWVQGDVTRLRQVLVNLVNNAVKFTPSGSIAISVRRIHGKPTTDSRFACLEFSVTDTGIGIPSDRLDRLFRPFSQVDSSTTRKYGGTGLGLAICHRLCALMGGEISVNSTVGLGSTFVFTIQIEPVNTPPGWGLPEVPARLNYGPVLCIEDHPVTQTRWQSFFQTWGARAVCAASAEAANEYLGSEAPPIAIVLDYEMTESPNGRVLREAISQNDIPTVLLLPPGQSAQQLEIFTGRRGIATATKPTRTHALIRAIQSLFDAPADSLPPFVVTSENKLLAHELPLDVLLVEDNPVNQKVALRFLDRLGYRADAVGNGLEAVNTLQNRSYHLVLMDLQMPEMDGFEAARQIRRRIPNERQPKIIALTANALHGDREQCLAAGMDDYITKPVKLLDIDQAIRRQFLRGSRPPLRPLS